MEALSRLVANSLARHGLDRPIDPRRLQWSRWFRCDSPHSLLVIPSKPGIFALAEEIMNFAPGSDHPGTATNKNHVETAAQACPERSRRGCPEQSSAVLGGAALQRCDSLRPQDAASAAEGAPKRMLAVLQFSEDDDMAYVLDRMFTRINPMRSRLAAGQCFVRFVVIEDQDQRRSICTALNQWLISSAEKASGLPADFSSSLELNTAHEANREGADRVAQALSAKANAAAHLDSGASRNLHCPHPLPFGF